MGAVVAGRKGGLSFRWVAVISTAAKPSSHRSGRLFVLYFEGRTKCGKLLSRTPTTIMIHEGYLAAFERSQSKISPIDLLDWDKGGSKRTER